MRFLPSDDVPVKKGTTQFNESLLTAADARELLAFNEKTGVLRWRVDRRGKAKAGTKAGSVAGQGHIQVRINGIRYYAHRLVWLLAYGTWPPAGFDVDHVDGDRANNRLGNLRLATPAQNQANTTKLRKTNTSGYRGVSWHHARKRWEARIRLSGRRTFLGYFDDVIDAARAYDAAYFSAFGEFASFLNFPDEAAVSVLEQRTKNAIDRIVSPALAVAGGVA